VDRAGARRGAGLRDVPRDLLLVLRVVRARERVGVRVAMP
jgi:hypothetical protein